MSTEDRSNVAFWATEEDADMLYHESEEEAAIAYLEELGRPTEDLPDEITLYGFAPLTADDNDIDYMAQSVAEMLRDMLDETFGDIDNDETEITEEFKSLAKDFVRKVVAEYPVAMHELVETKTYSTDEVIEQYFGEEEEEIEA